MQYWSLIKFLGWLLCILWQCLVSKKVSWWRLFLVLFKETPELRFASRSWPCGHMSSVTAPPVCLELGIQRWGWFLSSDNWGLCRKEWEGKWYRGCCKSRELGRIVEELKRFANKNGAWAVQGGEQTREQGRSTCAVALGNHRAWGGAKETQPEMGQVRWGECNLLNWGSCIKLTLALGGYKSKRYTLYFQKGRTLVKHQVLGLWLKMPTLYSLASFEVSFF